MLSKEARIEAHRRGEWSDEIWVLDEPIMPYCCRNELGIGSRWRAWSVQDSPNRLLVKNEDNGAMHKVRRSTFDRVKLY